jgi:hypothetical protein
LAGLVCGSVVWALSIPLTGFAEPFDSPGPYYVIAMFIAGLLAALPNPRYWWAAVIGIFLGERVYAFLMVPETRPWLLFGIMVNFLILSWLPAAIGAVCTYAGYRWMNARARG